MDIFKENQVKEAFQRIKHDIYSLYSEISSLKREMSAMKHDMAKVSEILIQLSKLTQTLSKIAENMLKTPVPTHPAIQQENPTVPTHIPAHFPQFNKGNQRFSTGNEGVPTDRQTDQQTDNTALKEPLFTQKYPKTPQMRKIINPIEDAARALDSLDSLKKEIRLKFKQLTDQEILVFSVLYQMEEEQGPVDYKTIALKLNLTESSIRDYIGRLLQKGVPIEKQRINNKKIILSVSPSLKRVASLQTILQLRDL